MLGNYTDEIYKLKTIVILLRLLLFVLVLFVVVVVADVKCTPIIESVLYKWKYYIIDSKNNKTFTCLLIIVTLHIPGELCITVTCFIFV